MKLYNILSYYKNRITIWYKIFVLDIYTVNSYGFIYVTI